MLTKVFDFMRVLSIIFKIKNLGNVPSILASNKVSIWGN